MAKEEGLYKAEGLNVNFMEGGPLIDWQERMKDVRCPIGITNPYEIVIARARGVPVKAVAAVDQVSPIVWFALEESGIKDPRQFRGKKIALVPTGKIHLRGMIMKVGVPYEEMRLVPFSLDMTPLYKGEVDVWSGYSTNLVTRAEQEGHKVHVIHPINYGIQIYDDIIYVREELINDSPHIVERFLRASLKGWTNAIRAPDLAVTHTLTYSKQNRNHETGLFLKTVPYVHTGEVPVGWMEKAVWEDICSLTREVGLTASVVSADEIFTDTFLKAVYHEGTR
jgi:NitT/TauT family transport system substrate-binding protein